VNTTRRSFIRTVAICTLLAPAGATGQRIAPASRVALVFGAVPLAEIVGPEPIHPYARTFVHALQDLGFVEGRNVIIERRSAEGRPERMAALMHEIVALRVDVIVTTGGPGVRAALRATDRIAIVGLVDDVLETAIIESLSRPGRNLTGIGDNSPSIYGKNLQLLKEAAPAISRVAVIGYRPLPGPRAQRNVETEVAARRLGLDLLWLGVDAPEDFDAAFATMIREHADALYALGTHVNYAYRDRIGDFALKQRLPSIGILDSSMLLSYESDFIENIRRAAALVKKILDGAKPADLPFEQPTNYRLVIDLKTAKAIGITIPQSLLLRADEVIQ